jgi:hypothetical protein
VSVVGIMLTRDFSREKKNKGNSMDRQIYTNDLKELNEKTLCNLLSLLNIDSDEELADLLVKEELKNCIQYVKCLFKS